MYCHIYAGGLRGLESYVAQVEVDVSRGLPCFDMVGLLASEVKEARERIRVALRNAGVSVPAEKITVNISPAGIHKAGTAFDLPAALGIMAAQGLILQEQLEGMLAVGELGLDARVKPIRGILPMMLAAANAGIRECLLPLENLKEAMLAGEGVFMGVESLEEAAQYLCVDEKNRAQLRRKARLRAQEMRPQEENGTKVREMPDFSMVKGMEEAKNAALTAAAGFHNILLAGPPGAGKTMVARCISTILPPLSQEEQREISAIYSVAGQLAQGRLMEERPFVSPHHTASPYALTGGGAIPRPGMVSLAHKGILFLDEMAEFRRATLDILRQPLEEGRIFLAKSGGNFVYPADFMLVGATNPCPCGYYPDRNRCQCSQGEIHRYLSRISGPLLDRIDICATVRPVPLPVLLRETPELSGGQDSAALRSLVMQARERQNYRYRGTCIGVNGRLGTGEVLRYCHLGFSQEQFLERLAGTAQCSVRGCYRVIRTARTLADLEGAQDIGNRHLSQAFYFRRSEPVWG